MDEARLPSEVWVKAQLRRLNDAGRPAVLLRRGEKMGGLVLVKINSLGQGCRVLSQTRDLDGRPAWLAAFKGASVDEGEADDYIARAVKRDPDLWVVEIEDPSGQNPFDGKVL